MKVFFSMTFYFFLANLFYTSNAFTCDEHGKTGIVEKNDLWIGEDDKRISNVNKESFNRVIDDIERIYESEIRSKGAYLNIERNWSDGTVNAYASQSRNVWTVAMFGGLARHESITSDAFALVLCHELGHHIGGASKKVRYSSNWATNEGQADYFAALKCLRRYFSEQDNNIRAISDISVPRAVNNKCEQNFSDENDIAICKRSAMAGLALGNFFRDLRQESSYLYFTTPDPTEVRKTYDGHPNPQCRLDTFFAGSVCPADVDEKLSDHNVSTGACVKSEGHRNGTRPLCWYKPRFY